MPAKGKEEGPLANKNRCNQTRLKISTEIKALQTFCEERYAYKNICDASSIQTMCFDEKLQM